MKIEIEDRATNKTVNFIEKKLDLYARLKEYNDFKD
jgi:hypothetical protein